MYSKVYRSIVEVLIIDFGIRFIASAAGQWEARQEQAAVVRGFVLRRITRHRHGARRLEVGRLLDKKRGAS